MIDKAEEGDCASGGYHHVFPLRLLVISMYVKADKSVPSTFIGQGSVPVRGCLVRPSRVALALQHMYEVSADGCVAQAATDTTSCREYQAVGWSIESQAQCYPPIFHLSADQSKVSLAEER